MSKKLSLRKELSEEEKKMKGKRAFFIKKRQNGVKL